MRGDKTQPVSPREIKHNYLHCFGVRAGNTAALTQVVKVLVEQGVSRATLMDWAVGAGHSRATVASVLSRILCALGWRERREGAGRKVSPEALELLAFARVRYGLRHVKILCAAWRVGKDREEEERPQTMKGTRLIELCNKPSAKIILSTHQPLRIQPMNHSSPNSASRPSPPSEGGATRAAGRPARVPAGGKEPARAPDTSSVSQRSQIAPDGADGAARHPCLLKVAGLALRDPRARPSGRNTFIPHFALRTPRFLPLLLFLALLSTARAQDTTPPQLDGSTQTNTAAAITNAILYGGVWYNPLFYPPPPAQPVLSQADAIAAAWTLYQATNSTPSNQLSAPAMGTADASAASNLHPLTSGQIRVDAASNRAIADYGPSHVSWAPDITDPDGTVDMLTPAGQELKSYVAGLYYLSADGQSSALIASLQSSTAQVVLPSQILYSDAFVSALSGASAGIDVLYNYDLYSMSQDLVMRRQIPPPSAFSASLANPYAPDLRLGVITVFPGLTQQPTLVPSPVNPDDYGPSNPAPTEPDTDIIFAGARMVTGHAFLAGNNPTPIFVVKSWQYINQNWCLVESVQLSQVQSALGQLPPATASLTLPQNGRATRAAGAPPAFQRAERNSPAHQTLPAFPNGPGLRLMARTAQRAHPCLPKAARDSKQILAQ